MSNDIINAFVEGRGSLASLERAIQESSNPLAARAEFEKELAAEWALKNLFASIPPPKEGITRVMAALRSAQAPAISAERSEQMSKISSPLRATMKGIPEPAGGFSAAIERLKSKLAATPLPATTRSTEMDIQPLAEMPAAGTDASGKPRRATQKIVQMPRSSRRRDVLAAGKDLPENPEDLK